MVGRPDHGAERGPVEAAERPGMGLPLAKEAHADALAAILVSSTDSPK